MKNTGENIKDRFQWNWPFFVSGGTTGKKICIFSDGGFIEIAGTKNRATLDKSGI